MVLEAFWIASALAFQRPDTRMQSSIWLRGASARVLGVTTKNASSFAYARSVFVSAVFWEIIVTTKASKGSAWALTRRGSFSVSFKVDRIAVASG